ncbi:hypothetical protein ACIQXD_05105 [Streptomyces uncialis]|uniref:hypothetical protein n=1 Tax=Streptomyces uncialis TaxID=1048205 RepID=UPI0037FC46E3
MEIAATSTEYVRVTARSKAAGSVITVAAPPKFAILPASRTGNPDTGDWLTGEWSGTWARLLVGPGGAITLDPGEYVVWLSWAAGTEAPVYRASGTITVY